jgi:hypothetical protein
VDALKFEIETLIRFLREAQALRADALEAFKGQRAERVSLRELLSAEVETLICKARVASFEAHLQVRP